MGLNKKECFKWGATGLIVLISIVIIVVAVTASRRANDVLLKDDGGGKEAKQLEGRIENVYVISSDKDTITFRFDGYEYVFEGALERPYVGVADLEVKDGQILNVSAKTASIEGKLDRYTEELVQLSGYEALNYSGELPVYVLQKDVFLGEKRLSDLVIGTSQIQLVVAEGRACAILQYCSDSYENIRILIKNKSKLFYSNIYITSERKYKVEETKKKGKTVTNIKKAMKECREGDEICISPGEGLLYLCDKEGNHLTDGYEGSFLVRKTADGYVLINEVPIETYLRYVIPSEMPTYFSYEALKAQAVCARTFAYKQMQGSEYAEYGANLDDSSSYQVYHAASTYEITDQAVLDTEDIVMTYDGELIDCYYYSTSPGYAEDLEVWNAKSPAYLKKENHTKEKDADLSSEKAFHKFIQTAVESYDDESPYYRWTAEISGRLGMDEEYGRLQSLKVNERSTSGYIRSLTVTFENGERTYERENEIRFALGRYVSTVTLANESLRKSPGSVPSACFEIVSANGGEIVLSGGGFGHGIGMSQYGADGMAREGAGWQEILQFYYKDIAFSSLSEEDAVR